MSLQLRAISIVRPHRVLLVGKLPGKITLTSLMNGQDRRCVSVASSLRRIIHHSDNASVKIVLYVAPPRKQRIKHARHALLMLPLLRIPCAAPHSLLRERPIPDKIWVGAEILRPTTCIKAFLI